MPTISTALTVTNHAYFNRTQEATYHTPLFHEKDGEELNVILTLNKQKKRFHIHVDVIKTNFLFQHICSRQYLPSHLLYVQTRNCDLMNKNLKEQN